MVRITRLSGPSSLAERLALVDEVVSEGDVGKLPALLSWLSPDLYEAMARACAALLEPVRPEALLGVDGLLRQWYPGDGWMKLERATLMRLGRLPQGRWLLAAISCHRNGHLRELAVRQLAGAPQQGWEAAFYALRLSDWALPVRVAARDALLRLEWGPERAPLLPLLERLRLGQRGDPESFIEELEGRMGGLIDHALTHPDGAVRRAALRPGLRYREPVLVLGAALEDPCAGVMVRALQLSRGLDLGDDFWRARRRSRRAAVRRRAYQELASSLSESDWREALESDDPGVQELARFHCRGLDLRSFYREALAAGPPRVGLIRGLAAVGQAADLEQLGPLWEHRQARVLRALIAASARLGGDRELDRWFGCLVDRRTGVAGQAARALQPYAGRLKERLVELVWDEQAPLPSRGLALNLLEWGDKWSSLRVLLEVCGRVEPLRERAVALLERWLGRCNRRQLAPAPGQRESCRAALEAASLPQALKAQLLQMAF